MEKTLAERVVGLDVHHPTFGTGKVTMCTNVGMMVQFPEKETAFMFPYAFKTCLTVDDEELQKEIVEFYDSGDWTNPIHIHCEDGSITPAQ